MDKLQRERLSRLWRGKSYVEKYGKVRAAEIIQKLRKKHNFPSEEAKRRWRENISRGQKGRILWNKGKKGLQVAWNKGLTKETDQRVKKYAAKLPKARKGMKLSERHKRNIGKAIKGRIAPNKGIPASEETKKKLSNLLSGIKNPFYGKKHTLETRKKISLSRMGKVAGSKNSDYIGFDIEEYKEDIIKMYMIGRSTNALGKKYGVAGSTIGYYLKKWKISIRKGAYGFSGLIICKDGHKVRSYPELQIDNFLFENGIAHDVEKTFDFQNKQFKCDFYLPELDLYIEYWGIYHNEKYVRRKERKLEIYDKLRLNLLSIEWDEDPIEKLKFLIPLCATKQRILRT